MFIMLMPLTKNEATITLDILQEYQRTSTVNSHQPNVTLRVCLVAGVPRGSKVSGAITYPAQKPAKSIPLTVGFLACPVIFLNSKLRTGGKIMA